MNPGVVSVQIMQLGALIAPRIVSLNSGGFIAA
jgi:hypothetical protein